MQMHAKTHRSRVTYEKYMVGQRLLYVVTLDDAFIYVYDCTEKRLIWYVR